MNRKDVPTYIFSTRKIDFVIQITKKISSCSFFSIHRERCPIETTKKKKRININYGCQTRNNSNRNVALQKKHNRGILYYIFPRTVSLLERTEPIQLGEKIGVRVNINTGNWLELRARRQSSGVFVGRFQRELLYPAGCHPLIRVSRISTVNNRPLNPRLNPT